MVRFIPPGVRKAFEVLGGAAIAPSLLFEATVEDLVQSLADCGVDFAVVIASPPMAPNEFVLELAQHRSQILPVVTIPHGTPRPGHTLKQWVKKGAKGVKIHPAMHGGDLQSPTYRSVLNAASELGLPVIIHTGKVHLWPVYRHPEKGDALLYQPWLASYPDVKFIFAHMNFHFPHLVMDLMEEYPNLHTDTSWQPQEIIGEAVRRVGSDRLLFGSDWPLGGENLTVGLSRVEACERDRTIQPEDKKRILGLNAARLFGLQPPTGSLSSP